MKKVNSFSAAPYIVYCSSAKIMKKMKKVPRRWRNFFRLRRWRSTTFSSFHRTATNHINQLNKLTEHPIPMKQEKIWNKLTNQPKLILRLKVIHWLTNASIITAESIDENLLPLFKKSEVRLKDNIGRVGRKTDFQAETPSPLRNVHGL